MTKSVTKIQDKDTRKRLSVVRSKEDPTKYWVVILNPDWSKIKWPKGDPGPQGCPGPEGPSICDAQFSGVDIVFEKTNGCCVVLEDAATCLQWPQWCTWNGICCTTLNADYTLTLQYTNGCCDTTGSIRWEPGPQWCTWNAATVSVWSTTTCPAWCCATVSNSWDCHNAVLNFWIPKGDKWDTWNAATITVGNTCTGAAWTCACVTNTGTSCAAVLDFTIPKGDTGATWNGICCTTCSKVWKTTTVELQYTDHTCFCFDVMDGQDWIGAGDMLACVYDPNNIEKDAFDMNNMENRYNYAEPTTAAATATKCVCIPAIKELCVWQTIIIKPTITATNCATSLKLNDFDAYPVRYNNAALTSTTDGYVWWANQLSELLFDWSYWHVVSKSYDANTTYTMNYSVDSWKYKAWSGSYAISRYSLVLQKDDWTWETLKNTSTNYSTATTKTVNTHWFVLWKIRYYNTTTVVANGGLIATNTLNNKAASVDMRYSTNCGGTTDWAEWDFIYLVGTIWNDWLFYLDTTKWWSNSLPGAKDGKVYIRLWIALAAAWYTMSLLDDRPIFYYDNGIKVYQQADNKQDVITDLDDIRNCACCAMPNTTKYGASLDMTMDPATFVLQTQLKDQDGCNLWSACCIDLPLESVVVCGCYDCACKEVELDLQGWSCIRFWIGDLVCWLQTEIDGCHKICSDYVDDTGQCNLFVSCTEKNCWNWKAEVCDIPTDNCELCNGCGYTTCTWTLSSCSDVINALWYTPVNNTDLNTKTFYLSSTSDLTNAQAAFNWYKAGKEPLIVYNKRTYILDWDEPMWPVLYFVSSQDIYSDWSSYTSNGNTYINLFYTIPWYTVTSITTGTQNKSWWYLRTWKNYSTPYTPQYDWSPATKKYVDDNKWVSASCIACINGCCLTNGGNICIQWWQDYSWVTKTISWWQVELWLRTIVNVPTSDFTLVKPATLIDWEEYTIRVISETSYCMCLWSCFKNPWEVDTCLSDSATDQYVFLSIGWELELQPVVATGS